jgi:tetratricopeptide (TPR) repeat protein
MQKSKSLGIDLARIAKQQFPTLRNVPNELLVERIIGRGHGVTPACQRIENRALAALKPAAKDPMAEDFSRMGEAELKERFIYSQDENDKKNALSALADRVHELREPICLYLVAGYCDCPKTRKTAIDRIGFDEDTLRAVFLHSNYDDSKQIALDKLIDMLDQLRKIVTLAIVKSYCDDPKIKAKAKQRLEFLKKQKYGDSSEIDGEFLSSENKPRKRRIKNTFLAAAMLMGLGTAGFIGKADSEFHQARATAPAIGILSDALGAKDDHQKSYAAKMLHFFSKTNPKYPALLDTLPAMMRLIDSKKGYSIETMIQLDHVTEAFALIATKNLDKRKAREVLAHSIHKLTKEPFWFSRTTYTRIMVQVLEEEPMLLKRHIPQLQQSAQSQDGKIREQAQKILDTIADVYYYCGHYLQFGKSHTEAIEYYKVAMQINPSDYGSASYIAECFYFLEKYNESMNYAKLAVELGEQDSETMETNLLTIAWCYQKLGQYKDAITTYEKMLGVTKNKKFIYEEMGDCYRVMGQNESAEVAYKKAIEAFKEHNSGHYKRYIKFLKRKIENL